MEDSRLLDALENIALELERLRMLKEHELNVRIEYADGDPQVVAVRQEE